MARTYYATTTQNAQMSGYEILAVASNSDAALLAGEVALTARHPDRTEIHADTEWKNLAVRSETALKKVVGAARFDQMIEAFALAD